MCGIAALISLNDPSSHLHCINLMTDVINHRGPDDEGFIFFSKSNQSSKEQPYTAHIFSGKDVSPKLRDISLNYIPKEQYTNQKIPDSVVALGHRRLSIIDLSPYGHQPMCDSSSRYWIIFNGEVYNYIEIREELEAMGHHFVSGTDTEVILNAYKQWGKDCLSRFNGMWAFIIFDTKNGTLFASRDRFGVKPLYYWYSPEGFLAFASEIKEFTVLPGWNAKLNGSRAYDFLVSEAGLANHTSETLFRDVYQLRGGEAFEVQVSSLSTELPIYRWYDLKINKLDITFEEAKKEFLKLFQDAIRIRLRSDVPVGSCLSGGLDSSSIVCIVNDMLKEEKLEEIQKTFSVCSDVERIDERKFIDEVVKSRNIEAKYVYPSPEQLIDCLDSLIWHHDEPFDCTSIYAQWLVFQLASENGIKVMLDGQGSDEQLCGYHRFFGCRYAHLFKSLNLLTLGREIGEVRTLHGDSITESIMMMGFYLTPFMIRQKLKRLLVEGGVPPSMLSVKKLEIPNDSRQKSTKLLVGAPISMLSAKNLGVFNDSDNLVKLPSGDVIQKNCYEQLIYSVLPQLLHSEDRNSMAHSLESRVPFLDFRLVEFNLSLPPELKIADGYTKQILRESMSGILPEKILMRVDKIGFATAEESWMKGKNSKIFRQLFVESVESSMGIINEEALKKFDRMMEGKERFNSFAWRVISFGKWMKIFNVSV
jgi:asparagine synthase (glutamine-hydrolysing)